MTNAVGKTSPAELDKVTLQKAYARWAPVYDLVFGAVFDRGRRAAIAAAEQVGGRILEVGVGTGISLPGYSPQNRIIGIDLSEAMLGKAQRRVADLSLTNVEKLEMMDAEHLSFPDASFDVVVANHVISTVPNPEAALDECARMLRPGGEMILLSRIGADGGLRQLVERLLQPVVCRLGWRAEFPWDRFALWTERRTDVRLIERRPMPPLGHFSLLRFVKCEEAAEHEHHRPADSRLTAVVVKGGCPDEWLYADAENSALGRSPILSPQPRQPIASFIERDQLRSHLLLDVLGSGNGGLDRMDGLDDQPPDRPFLL